MDGMRGDVMNFWQFADNHWFVTLVALVIAGQVLVLLIQQPFRISNRYLRHRSIMKHGWPQAPVDADGDVVHQPTTEVGE